MVLKTFAQLSRQAQLAKNFWTVSTNSPTTGQRSSSGVGSGGFGSQSAFFVSTSQLPRHESQVVVRNQSGFGEGANNGSYNAPGLSSAISATFVNPLVFSQHTLLTSLDEEKDIDEHVDLAQGALQNTTANINKRSNQGFLLTTSVIGTHSLSYIRNASVDVDRRRFLSTLTTSSGGIASTKSEAILEPSKSKIVKSRTAKNKSLPHSRTLTTTVAPRLRKVSSSKETNTKNDEEDASTTTEEPISSAHINEIKTKDLSSPTDDVFVFSESSSPGSVSSRTSSGSVHALSLNEYETDEDCAIISDNEAISASQYIKTPPEVLIDSKLSESPAGKALTMEYNNSLLSLAKKAADDSVESLEYSLDELLDTYFGMLRKNIRPNTDTYTIVISSLITAANHYKYMSRRFPLYDHEKIIARHGNRLLPSVKEQTDIAKDGKAFLALAMDLFAASNSVKHRHYNGKLYESLLDCCINYGESKRLSLITDAFNKEKLSIPTDLPNFYSYLILGSGMRGDIHGALEFYEQYKANYHLLEGNTSPLKVYGSVISAFFGSKQGSSGIQFLEKILNSSEPFMSQDMVMSEDFEVVLSAVVDGFINDGDFLDAWNWIKALEQDKSIPSISLETISNLFSKVCFSSSDVDSGLVNEIFDFAASQSRSIGDPQFDNVRCDYLIFSIKRDFEENVYKGVKESHLRGGLWEETCLVNVVEYLCSKGKSDLALDAFQSQSSRLSNFSEEKDMTALVQAPYAEALTAVTNIFNAADNFDYYVAGTLACSDFASTEFFMRPSVTGVNRSLFEILCQSIKERSPSYVECLKSSRLLNLYVLHVLSSIIDTDRKSITAFQMARDVYPILVGDILETGMHRLATKDLSVLVSKCLEQIGANEISVQWQTEIASPKSASAKTSTVEFNTPVTQKITAYAGESMSLSSLYSELESVLLRKECVGPEAIVSLFEACNKQKAASFLSLIYNCAVKMYPDPLTSPEAWDIWVTINRAVIEQGSALNYPLAHRAYMQLLAMNSSPDATGYGHLIAHEPDSATRDEAGDALMFFKDASAHNVFPNTYLYNVTLSKLAKARQLKAAFNLFEEMSQRGVKKTSITYGTLISACCRAGDEENAISLFNKMESSPNYSPRIAPFNTIIQFYVHTKKNRGQALEYYQRLRNAGLRPSSHTYKLLIDCYSLIEPVDLNAADSVLNIIRQDHNPITTQHLAALLYARGVISRDLKSTSIFYKKLLLNNRVKPDKVIYQALLEAYVVNNRVTETNDILDEMVKYGVELNAYMANILIRGWAQQDLEKSVGIFNYVLKTGKVEPSSYESLVRAFICHKDFENASYVVDTMKSGNYPMAVIQKVASLIKRYMNETVINETELLFDSIFRHNSQNLTKSTSISTFVHETEDTYSPEFQHY